MHVELLSLLSLLSSAERMLTGGRVRAWAEALGADLLQAESPVIYAQYFEGGASGFSLL